MRRSTAAALRRAPLGWMCRRIALPPVETLAAGVLSGDRRSLSRAITLVESTNPEHARMADQLLQTVQERSAGRRCFRLAISGPPGTGKSCFVEALGSYLTSQGKRVAVLAVDPSSKVSGGSLLGDKTRMDKLAVDPNAYIRPTPTSGALGGLAEATHDALLLCEGAGWDVALVETVGVGQSETDAKELTDCFLLLLPPSAGDELQGMKKGIVEVADIIGITKDDGPTATLAKQAQAEYRKALQFLCKSGRAGAESDWTPPVLRLSSRAGTGIAELWETVMRYSKEEAKVIEARRGRTRVERMWASIRRDMLRRIEHDQEVAARLVEDESQVRQGTVVPRLAARRFLDTWLQTTRAA